MSILFDEEKRTFWLNTPNTSYVMGVADHFGYLLHYYYGKRLNPGAHYPDVLPWLHCLTPG